ncbi:MAG: DUF1854 domain-containing protein [Verrucomicrobiota bacterium]
MKTPAAHFDLQRCAAGTLVLTDAAGTRHDKVLPVRLFPLTDPTRWIAITNAMGQELVCIENADDLPGDVRKILFEALAERDFVPVIQVIHTIRHAALGCEWFVTTDRGKTRFCVENDENVEALGGGNVVVIDQHNTRYRIPALAALDPKSRQKFERFY